jgi:hypothetical protein
LTRYGEFGVLLLFNAENPQSFPTVWSFEQDSRDDS